MINTKKADRRTLKFASIADLRAELDRLEAAHHAGTLRHTGNWTPGAAFKHLGTFISYYYEGFPFKPPAVLRLIGPLFKKTFVTKGFKPGLKAPAAAEPEDCSFEEGLAHLRAQLDRIDAGDSLAGPNPVLGTITHDEGVQIHLRHAEHHLGFLWPERQGASPHDHP